MLQLLHLDVSKLDRVLHLMEAQEIILKEEVVDLFELQKTRHLSFAKTFDRYI